MHCGIELNLEDIKIATLAKALLMQAGVGPLNTWRDEPWEEDNQYEISSMHYTVEGVTIVNRGVPWALTAGWIDVPDELA